MSSATIALADLPRKLREIATEGAAVPSYRALYNRVLDGAIAAERRNGRWYVTESVAREVAKALDAGKRSHGRGRS